VLVHYNQLVREAKRGSIW